MGRNDPSNSSLEKEQNKVWETSWNLYRTPSVGTLRRARENLIGMNLFNFMKSNIQN
jgi:hypothetical protein